MIIHTLDPVFLHLGPFQIRYYGIIFALSFILTYFILKYLAKNKKIAMTSDELSEFILYLMIGVIGGARIGYVLIYNASYYANHLIETVMIWQGGLSFHGGLIGGIIAGYIFCKKNKKDILTMADLIAIPLALCLAFGRIANFINGELPGRITSVSWCVQFPGYTDCRHPSQIYASIKDFSIFGILWILKDKNLKKGTLASLFLILYGTFRFFVEFFREADVQVGYFFGLTMGQLLSIAVIICGILLYYTIQRKNK